MAQEYKALPPAEELWEKFALDPFSGNLYRVSPRNSHEALASRPSGDGYRRVRIGKQRFKAHRLVWAWINGKDPGHLEIDHVTGKEKGDAPWNLRSATHAQNAANQKSRGWDYDSRSGKYQARIRHNYRCLSLGAYNTSEEAEAAYKKAARDLRSEFARV
jgi:hypothetical protein